jgi:hypothetical protein
MPLMAHANIQPWWSLDGAVTLQVFFENGIRVAIIGTGWGVKVQVPQFRAAGINIFAIYSREQKKCAASLV